jgi:hypothetical protein
MQATAYANLTTRRLTSTLGGSAVSFPAFVQGDKVRIGLRFAESLEGSPIEVQKIVTHIRASIGFVDARPTSGSFVLNVDGQNTASIPHEATAGTLQAALASVGLNDAMVSKQDGSWIISTGTEDIEISGSSAEGLLVELRPVSFVRVRSMQVAGQYRHEVRLVQAPLASTASFDLIVPPAPTVSEVQAGGASATTLWPEIQALKIQPTFKGTYQLRRGFKKTRELSVDDGPEEIQDAISVLADDGGSFSVTNPATNIAHITFNGSMAGIDQELIEVAVFSAPPGDPTIILDLNTAEIAAALRGAAELKPELEIEVAIQDENDPTKTYTLTPFRAPISLIRELNWEGLETAANIDWLRPPYGRTYIPFTPDQIITGSQHYVAPIGDGVNSTFTISHNLGTRDLHVTVRQNGGGQSLIEPQSISFDSENDLTISFDNAPALNGYVAIISTAGPISTFQAHGHTLAQIEGLQLILDDLGGRLETLEGIVLVTGNGGANEKNSEILMEIPAIDMTIPAALNGQSARLPLLPAIHDATVESVAPPLGNAATFAGNVKQVSAAWIITAAKNRRAWPLKAGSYVASNGDVLYEVRKIGNSYFPVEFEHDLLMLHVSAEMFTAKRRFEWLAEPKLQLLGNTRAQYVLQVAFGTVVEDAGSGFAENMANIHWATPIISQRIILSSAAVTHQLAVNVNSDASANLTATASIYGRTQSVIAPAGADFALRARLLNFDPENRTSPRGSISLTMKESTAKIVTR